MTIIEIAKTENGGHRNLTYDRPVTDIPTGWAVIPDGMAVENFPFGEVTAKKINGIMTVTSWTPGVIPEVAPVDNEPTANDIINTLLGVAE